jgi:hypothetical protein
MLFFDNPLLPELRHEIELTPKLERLIHTLEWARRGILFVPVRGVRLPGQARAGA